MILEAAILPVLPGREDEFEAAFVVARPIIEAMPGCLGLELYRGLETPRHYQLLVRWRTLDDHVLGFGLGFGGSAQYARWSELLHHFYEPFPVVEPYAPLDGPTAASGSSETV